MQKNILSPVRLAFLALCLVWLAPTSAQAQGKFPSSKSLIRDNPEFLQLFQPVVSRASQSTVEIICKDKSVALGTVVGANGLILTLRSELDGPALVKLGNGRKLEAKVIGEHKQFNLALLKVETMGLVPAAWKPSKETPVGNWAISVGMGKTPIAIGVVSVAMRKMFVPKGGKAPPPNQGYLGVNLSTLSKEVKVEEVTPNSGAKKAGMKAGDIITFVAGKEITDGNILKNILQNYKPGDSVEVKVKRGDKEVELKVTLGPRPPSRNDTQNQMGSKLSKVRTGFPVILQHDSVVKPDECGGPLVDLEGKAIGINVARAGRTESWAIPTEALLPLLEEMKAGKHPTKEAVQAPGAAK